MQMETEAAGMGERREHAMLQCEVAALCSAPLPSSCPQRDTSSSYRQAGVYKQ